MTAVSFGGRAVAAEPRRIPGGWLARAVLGLALMAAGVAIIVHADAVRAVEAELSAWIAHRTTGLDTFVAPDRATFYWGIGSERTYGLTVTPECSSAYLLGPLAVVFAVLVVRRRLPVRRVLLGLVAGAVVVFAMNLLRLGLIALAVDTWGRGPGFWWSHVVAGSLIAIAGTITAFATALSLAFGRRRTRAPRTAPSRDRG